MNQVLVYLAQLLWDCTCVKQLLFQTTDMWRLDASIAMHWSKVLLDKKKKKRSQSTITLFSTNSTCIYEGFNWLSSPLLLSKTIPRSLLQSSSHFQSWRWSVEFVKWKRFCKYFHLAPVAGTIWWLGESVLRERFAHLLLHSLHVFLLDHQGEKYEESLDMTYRCG